MQLKEFGNQIEVGFTMKLSGSKCQSKYLILQLKEFGNRIEVGFTTQRARSETEKLGILTEVDLNMQLKELRTQIKVGFTMKLRSLGSAKKIRKLKSTD